MCKKTILRRELKEKAIYLIMEGRRDLKSFEVAYQDVIEEIFPDCCWWQVTNCDIFSELLATQDVFAVIDSICDNLKEVVCND